MRYPAWEKLEIIRLVEQSHLPAGETLEKLGILRSTFSSGWYDRYRAGGAVGLMENPDHPRPGGSGIVFLTRCVSGSSIWLLERWSCASRRELAPHHRQVKIYFVSEASNILYQGTRPDFIAPPSVVMKAADEFKDKTTAPNQLWQPTSRTEGDRLGLVLSEHDPGRLLPLHHRLEAVARRPDRSSGCDQARVVNKPRLLGDRGLLCLRRAGKIAGRAGYGTVFVARPIIPQTQGKIERWHQKPLKNRILLENYYLPGDLKRPIRQVRLELLQPPPLSREPEKPPAGRCLLRARANYLEWKEKGSETRHHPEPPFAASKESRPV